MTLFFRQVAVDWSFEKEIVSILTTHFDEGNSNY